MKNFTRRIIFASLATFAFTLPVNADDVIDSVKEFSEKCGPLVTEPAAIDDLTFGICYGFIQALSQVAQGNCELNRQNISPTPLPIDLTAHLVDVPLGDQLAILLRFTEANPRLWSTNPISLLRGLSATFPCQ